MIRVAVIGGGISGLAAAHRLVELSRERDLAVDVVVLEARERAGGHVRTERVGDLVLETGPDQFVTYKPAALALCRRIGLADELLEMPSTGRGTQVLVDGRWVTVPEGLLLVAPSRLGPLLRSPLLSWPGKLRAACEPFVPARRESDDESVGAFITRRWGRQLLDRLGEPLLAGIFMGDVDTLSAESTLPRLRALERRAGSVARGLAGGPPQRRGGFVTVRSGLSRLIERLVERLPPDSLRTGTTARAVLPHAGGWRVAVDGGTDVEADAVILACPAPAAARIVRPARERLADCLERVTYASCASVYLGYAAASVPRPLEGYGFFVARSEGLPLLACSQPSSKFPERGPADVVVLRAFLGGARQPGLASLPPERILALAREALSTLLGLSDRPILEHVDRFEQALVEHPVGFAETVRRGAELAGDGLFLCSGSAGAVGLPDCVATAERIAEEALAGLATADARGSRGRSRAGPPRRPNVFNNSRNMAHCAVPDEESA